MNQYEIKGILHHVADVEVFESGFKKREFVIQIEDGKYPQNIKIEAIKDDVLYLESYLLGDSISCSFNLRGNEYNGKFYVSLQAWKFDRKKPGAAPAPAAAQQRSAMQSGAKPPEKVYEKNEDDDVPF
jgi:single-strand DNA-binding protein